MTGARRLTLAIVLAGAAAGLFSRMAPLAPASTAGKAVGARQPNFERLSVAVGDRIGPYAFDGVQRRAGVTLRLRSPACDGPIFMTPYDAAAAAPAQLIALRYPAAQWSSLHVYQGRAYDNFEHFFAQMRALAARARDPLLLAPIDYADQFYFLFHAPAGCALAHDDAVAATRAVLAVATGAGQ